MLKVVSRDEHVPKVEQPIRTIKERCLDIYNMLSFKKVPNQIIVKLAYCVNFWLHAFPAEDRKSAYISPRELVLGITLDFNMNCLMPIGAYVQANEKHEKNHDH